MRAMLLLVVALVAMSFTRSSAQMVNMMDTETGDLYEVIGFNTFAFQAPDRYEQLPTQTFAARVPYLESDTSIDRSAQVNQAPAHITNPEINVAADTTQLSNDQVLPTQTFAARIPLQQSSVATNSRPLIRQPTFIQTNPEVVVTPGA